MMVWLGYHIWSNPLVRFEGIQGNFNGAMLRILDNVESVMFSAFFKGRVEIRLPEMRTKRTMWN